MNTGYAGCVEIPDNLNQLFRTMAMNRPDTELITEVLLFSQDFASAEQLAPKFVLLFSMAKESLSSQTHYDFGLSAMKSVLTNAGQLIRAANIGENDRAPAEARLLVSSIVNELFPKLLTHNLTKLTCLMVDVFPGVSPQLIEQNEFLTTLHEEASAAGWIDSDIWVQKIIQLFYIQQINHDFMLVGNLATGKTSAWSTLLRVLTKLDKIESESYIINPKSVTKDTLFGCHDPVTRDWTDGVFIRILRNIIANQKGLMEKRHWIVFDGDVDPEWVENLNSVLNDNKLLTLPNGERIALPPNVRVVFEVENLNYATPATVSRCGIVYFSQNTLNANEITHFHLHKLATEPILTPTHLLYSDYMDMPVPTMLELQSKFAELCKPSIEAALAECIGFWNENSESAAMEIPIASSTLFSLLSASFVKLFRVTEPDLVMEKVALLAAYWAFASPFPMDCRIKLDERLWNKFKNAAPDGPIYEFYINADAVDWAPASTTSETVDGFVPTAETELIRRLVQMLSISGKSVVLCGQSSSPATTRGKIERSIHSTTRFRQPSKFWQILVTTTS